MGKAANLVDGIAGNYDHSRGGHFLAAEGEAAGRATIHLPRHTPSLVQEPRPLLSSSATDVASGSATKRAQRPPDRSRILHGPEAGDLGVDSAHFGLRIRILEA